LKSQYLVLKLRKTLVVYKKSRCRAAGLFPIREANRFYAITEK